MRNTAITHKPLDKRCAHLSSKVLKGLEEKTLPRDSHPNLPRALQQTHTMRALGFGLQTWRLCTVAFHTHLLELCGWRSPFSTRNSSTESGGCGTGFILFWSRLRDDSWPRGGTGRPGRSICMMKMHTFRNTQTHFLTQSYHTVGFLIIDASEFNLHQN